MKEEIKQISMPTRFSFFLVGIIATLAYRIIIVLNFYDPGWVKVSWYIGTVGFILYFGHRFDAQRRRVKLIEDYDLHKVVKKVKGIKPQQKSALTHVIRTTYTSKSRWNSAVILILSVLALIVGIIFDFFIV
jgi:hypothetical protein